MNVVATSPSSLKATLEATVPPDDVASQFQVAACVVRVIGAPRMLEPCTAAFRHLPPSNDVPDVTIYLRDEMPDLSEVAASGLRHFADASQGHTYYWEAATQTAALHLYRIGTTVRATPMLPLLNIALRGKDTFVIHAGAVATEAGAALLIGKGGSGKSTTSLLSLQAGLHFLADDYCAIRATEPPTVHSLYASAKVHFDNAFRLPFIRWDRTPEYDKGYAWLAPTFADRLRTHAPVRALLHPAVSDELKLEPLRSHEALMTLAPNTILQLQSDAGAFAAMAHLTRRVPSYRLHLGPDPSAVPTLIEHVLKGRA